RGCSLLATAVDSASGKGIAAQFYLYGTCDSENWHVGGNQSEGRVGSFCSLVPGDYSVSATTLDGRGGFVRNVTLVPGLQQTVEVAVQRGASIVLENVSARRNSCVASLWQGNVFFGAYVLAQSSKMSIVAPIGESQVRWQGESKQAIDNVVLYP